LKSKILITGAKGFLGQNVSRYFKSLSFETYGIGHGDLSTENCLEIGLDNWYKSDITVDAIKNINQSFDLIVHCGGSGSVGFSVENPYQDFKKTVDGTLEVLEYMRLYNQNAYFIYPSSPAVQGECENIPIKEDYIGQPASPYGYHKKISEDLCHSYSEKYNLNIGIVRLFSVYGIGLKKQLLWDACNKINNAQKDVLFWGTGKETRDFIHIVDVLYIIEKLYLKENNFIIVNGGTGVKYSILEIVNFIKESFNKNINIDFNNKVDIGNPQYYCANTDKLNMLLDKHKFKNFKDGIKEYVLWHKQGV
jgi:UDP-glucose 4-epimerase